MARPTKTITLPGTTSPTINVTVKTPKMGLVREFRQKQRVFAAVNFEYNSAVDQLSKASVNLVSAMAAKDQAAVVLAQQQEAEALETLNTFDDKVRDAKLDAFLAIVNIPNAADGSNQDRSAINFEEADYELINEGINFFAASFSL